MSSRINKEWIKDWNIKSDYREGILSFIRFITEFFFGICIHVRVSVVGMGLA
jgi:hypothetical protein